MTTKQWYVLGKQIYAAAILYMQSGYVIFDIRIDWRNCFWRRVKMDKQR